MYGLVDPIMDIGGTAVPYIHFCNAGYKYTVLQQGLHMVMDCYGEYTERDHTTVLAICMLKTVVYEYSLSLQLECSTL